MVFGKLSNHVDMIAPFNLNGIVIEFVDSWRYLRFFLVSSFKITFSAQSDLGKSYKAANSNLNVLRKPKEDVLLHL
jgi:hypothetical protein